MKTARKIFSVILILVLVGSLGFSFFAVSSTIAKLGTSVAANSSDVTLASASADHASTASLAVTYWQQTADPCANFYDLYTANNTRQFEWSKCGYLSDAVETGLVFAELGPNNLPVPAHNGSLLPNRNLHAGNFNRWFHAVDGLSTEHHDIIKLSHADNAYTFADANFQPVTDLFTMSLAIPYRVLDGGGHFAITADDDTWVFLNNTLAADLGGIHRAATAEFDIAENGTLYLFHANRDSATSTLSFELSNVTLDAPSSTLAYDGSSYVAPLGESTSVAPDYHQALLTTITIEFIVLGMLIVFTPLVVRVVFRQTK